MDLGRAWMDGLGLGGGHEADEEKMRMRTAGVKGCGSSERGAKELGGICERPVRNLGSIIDVCGRLHVSRISAVSFT